jgi:hypothetical protein
MIFKCFIASKGRRYAVAKTLTQWFFYFGAIAFSGVTALIYLASTYAGRRLHAGKCWIGFPSRTNRLLRFGPFGELGGEDRELRWGFSLLVICVAGRKFDIVFIHYLVPLAPDPPANDVPLHPYPNRPANGEAEDGQNPRRDAWKLLMSVIHFIFTTTPAYLCILAPYIRFPISEFTLWLFLVVYAAFIMGEPQALPSCACPKRLSGTCTIGIPLTMLGCPWDVQPCSPWLASWNLCSSLSYSPTLEFSSQVVMTSWVQNRTVCPHVVLPCVLPSRPFI